MLDGASGEGVLILPTASAPEGDRVFDRWGRMGVDHYAAAGVAAEVVPLKKREDAMRPDLSAKLDDAAVVYFSGGNPAYLAATLADTPFWHAVQRSLDRGMTYAGCSAGIAALGEVAPDSTSNDPTSAHFWRAGLGLFPRMYFGPHWDALDTYVPGLRQTIIASVPSDSRLLAVDEDTAVVGDGTSWRVIGAGKAALLVDGEWSEHPAGSTFEASLQRR
jgi:cyanophycinase